MLIPVITEKSVMDAQKGKYTFKTSRFMHKAAIAQMVHDTFSVDVVDVATTIVKGRSRRFGARRLKQRQTPWKKAIVTVKKGQKIGLFDIGEQK